MSAKLYSTAIALECMQCDKNAAWYSEEEHERHIELCQNGLVPPTLCRNHSHTHCIVSWYRSGDSKEKVVTERKCGGPEDITGCTLYNSKISRKVRHPLSKDETTNVVRRETSTLFVEVCSESCPYGSCLNSFSANRAASLATILLVYLLRL
ncbi:unnamed protein product [Cylicocyclus nassatus]|uniref:Uncharacterized protein n=1 Tax=Cylicocyclus nassatus TaxID=53992 RepID=A0AA36M1L6_CYLNA|nr:unnamed protein product [Cylicocyclus nassatus]